MFWCGTLGRLGLIQGLQPVQRRPDVPLDADGAAPDLPGGAGRLPVDAGVDRLWVPLGHLPEGILDDAGDIMFIARHIFIQSVLQAADRNYIYAILPSVRVVSNPN